jgi:hypothetical protein
MEATMTTAEEVKDEALSLAQKGLDDERAISLLLTRADRRVPVVMAKRLLEAQLFEDPSDSVATALKFVEEILERDIWAE